MYLVLSEEDFHKAVLFSLWLPGSMYISEVILDQSHGSGTGYLLPKEVIFICYLISLITLKYNYDTSIYIL